MLKLLVILIRHDIYPARGRKQMITIAIYSIAKSGIRHDIYPARGRKQHLLCKQSLRLSKIRHDIYPARGRKRYLNVMG